MISFFNIFISSDEIIYFLKQEVRLKSICQEIIHQKIIAQAAQERQISVEAEEIQAEADRLRYENRLESASATFAWLADQLITPDDWEKGIHTKLLATKISKQLFKREAEKYFIQNKTNFEKVLLYRLVVPSHEIAQEILYQIEEKEISFYEAAHFYDIHEERRLKCGYEGKFCRWNLSPNLASLIFSANIGETIGPIPSEEGFDLFRVEEFLPAILDDSVCQQLLDQLFKEWLESEVNYLIHNNSSPKISKESYSS